MMNLLDVPEAYVPQNEQCLGQLLGEHGGQKVFGSSEPTSLVEGLIAHQAKCPKMKRGIKCPSLLYNDHFHQIYSDFYPKTDLIVGVRHPVSWFQSYYNYRLKGVSGTEK